MSESCPRCWRPRWLEGVVSSTMVTNCFHTGDPTCQLAEQRNTAQAALRALLYSLKTDMTQYVEPEVRAAVRTAEAVVEFRAHLYSRFCFCAECHARTQRSTRGTSVPCTHEPEPFSPVCGCSDECRCRKDLGPCVTRHIPE